MRAFAKPSYRVPDECGLSACQLEGVRAFAVSINRVPDQRSLSVGQGSSCKRAFTDRDCGVPYKQGLGGRVTGSRIRALTHSTSLVQSHRCLSSRVKRVRLDGTMAVLVCRIPNKGGLGCYINIGLCLRTMAVSLGCVPFQDRLRSIQYSTCLRTLAY